MFSRDSTLFEGHSNRYFRSNGFIVTRNSNGLHFNRRYSNIVSILSVMAIAFEMLSTAISIQWSAKKCLQMCIRKCQDFHLIKLQFEEMAAIASIEWKRSTQRSKKRKSVNLLWFESEWNLWISTQNVDSYDPHPGHSIRSNTLRHFLVGIKRMQQRVWSQVMSSTGTQSVAWNQINKSSSCVRLSNERHNDIYEIQNNNGFYIFRRPVCWRLLPVIYTGSGQWKKMLLWWASH